MVEVDRKTAKRLKPPRGLVRPEFRVGNYLLTTEGWEGIPENEVPGVKIFIKDAAPYLGEALNAIELFQRRLETTKHLKRQQVHEAFTPMIQLTKMFGTDVQYHLRFTWDGAIFLDREDEVMTPSKDGKGWDFAGVRVFQPVGELHYVGREEGTD